jgi:hypothetical protein
MLCVCVCVCIFLRVCWGFVQAVKDALEAALPEVSRPEVQLAKAELDNHTIVYQLTEALSKGAAAGEVGFLDLSSVDSKSLAERIHLVEEMGIHTRQAEALVAIAKIIRRVRELMVCGRWGRVWLWEASCVCAVGKCRCCC